MRRLVYVIAVLALMAVACGDSAVDVTMTEAGAATTTTAATEAVATTEPVVGGTEVAAATGGTVASDDGELKVEIPAGALAEDTAIAVTRLDMADWPEGFADAGVVGDVYDLRPSGLTFSEPVTISQRITETDTGLDFDSEVPLTLLVVMSDEGVGEAAADQVVTRDGDDLIHTAALDHFSVTALVGGLVTVKFTPTYVQPRVGKKFKATISISVKGPRTISQASDIVVFDVNFTSVARASVDTVAPDSFRLSGSSLRVLGTSEPKDVEYRCSVVGQGVYGVSVLVSPSQLGGGPFREDLDTLVEDLDDPEKEAIEKQVRQFTTMFFHLPPGALKPALSPVTFITGTALCRDGDGAPPPGTQVRFEGDLISTNPEQCLGFDAALVAVFGDAGDADGFLFYDYEFAEGLTGHPFTLDGDVLVVERYEVPSFYEDQQHIESWVVNLGQGKATLTNEASGPGLDLTCIWNMQFPPTDIGELG